MIEDDVSELRSNESQIAALIEAETAAFLDRNIEALCDCWANAPYIQHLTVLPYAGVVPVHGISGLRTHFLSHFRINRPLNINPEFISRKNWQFVIRENMAWVTFEQQGSSDAEHMSGSQMHTRILEKVDGHWKIIQSTGILPRLDFYDSARIHIDGSGKVLHISKDSEDIVSTHPALKISNGRLTATLQIHADRLTRVIEGAARDIANGKAQLPVPVIFGDPAEDESSLCWVAILDMQIVVLLDDDRLINTTIETAGQIYGLTNMQMRVAQEIAKGQELAAIATKLDITTNTVRTHVKRMFERVGANNQKMLLKKLLSAQSPSTGIQQQL